MPIDTTTSNQPSTVSNSALGFRFNSCACIDITKFSQSELYSLSRSTSSDYDVLPNINYVNRPTTSTNVNTPRRILAFSNRRKPHRPMSGTSTDTVTEDKLILNSLQKLIDNREKYGSNATGDTAVVPEVVVGNPARAPVRKRKKKLKNDSEFEGLGLVNVNGEVVDLKHLARDADGACECELKRMTEGMVREDEFLGFLNGLNGRWGSSRKRRKYVDGKVFVKTMPVGWEILLSLRPRVSKPSLYCRRFVSPSGEHFKSCKDVAFYLKSQFATDIANTPVVDLESGAQVHRSSNAASKNNFFETKNFHEVPTHNLINSNISKDLFASVIELESHQEKYHGNTKQSLDMDALTREQSVPCGLLLIREPTYPPSIVQNSVKQDTVKRCNELKDITMNGEVSSSVQKNNSGGKVNLKTRCVWCLVEFIHGPVDAETLASSAGFICSNCKEVASRNFESALSRLTQCGDN